MKPVVQEENTGCAIASAAAITGLSYREARRVAAALGIHADDPLLWSGTDQIRRLLAELGVATGERQLPFSGWDTLPDCALLATKWHVRDGRPHWHWAVFVREAGSCYVLDSSKSLQNNLRRDFGRIKPKWYLEVFV